MSRSVSVTAAGQCRLAPLIQVILDCSHLYDYTVKLLFKLHSCECPQRGYLGQGGTQRGRRGSQPCSGWALLPQLLPSLSRGRGSHQGEGREMQAPRDRAVPGPCPAKRPSATGTVPTGSSPDFGQGLTAKPTAPGPQIVVLVPEQQLAALGVPRGGTSPSCSGVLSPERSDPGGGWASLGKTRPHMGCPLARRGDAR